MARLGESGYVVFVAGAIPGDRVRAVVYKRKRSYAHARTLEVLEPSPERIPPTAHHPGVPWQVLPYERQLEVKAAQVREALRAAREASRASSSRRSCPAVERWRYRNKLEYSFGGGGEEASSCAAFTSPPAGGAWCRSTTACSPPSAATARARRRSAWCREQGLGSWDRGRGRVAGEPRGAEPGPDARGRARLRNLVVREGRRTGKLQIRIVTTDGELEAGELAAALAGALGEDLAGVLWSRTRRPAETTAGGDTELVWGEAELPERLCDLDLRISPEAFLQTNTEMAEVLYAAAAEYAALEGWERIYDLYAGIGTIALTLAPHAGEVWGIELVPEAVADAIAAARRHSITNVHFFAGDARLALPELLERAGRPDVLVVDPPRAGLSKKVVHRIIETSPRRIVYISCNPTTLAPNAAELVSAGWALRRVRPVDMFPQTHHIESVALLERG